MFAPHPSVYSIADFNETLLADYKAMNIQGIYDLYQHAILDADLVLMDGIALQVFYYLAKRKRLQNLNGTDFCPYFFSYVKEKHPNKSMNIILYGTYPHLLVKTEQFLIDQ